MGAKEQLVLGEENPIQYLFSSPYRIKVLKAVEEEQKSPSNLSRELQIPRSSLHRTITTLETKGWVYRYQSTIKLEPTGQYILDFYREVKPDLEIVSIATEISPWIKLDYENIQILRGGDTVIKGGEQRPLDVLLEWLDEDTPFIGFLPKIPTLFDKIFTTLSGKGLDSSTLVISKDNSSKERCENLKASFQGNTMCEQFNLDFGLFYNMSEVSLVGMNDVGDLKVLVTLSNEFAKEFAIDKFEKTSVFHYHSLD